MTLSAEGLSSIVSIVVSLFLVVSTVVLYRLRRAPALERLYCFFAGGGGTPDEEENNGFFAAPPPVPQATPWYPPVSLFSVTEAEILELRNLPPPPEPDYEEEEEMEEAGDGEEGEEDEEDDDDEEENDDA